MPVQQQLPGSAPSTGHGVPAATSRRRAEARTPAARARRASTATCRTHETTIPVQVVGRGRGGSLVDFLVLLIVTKTWDRSYETGGVWAVLVVCLLLLVPFCVAAGLTYRCTAWNQTEGRCANRRPGPFRRCELAGHSRAAQFVTAPEVAMAASFLVGFLDLWLLFTIR